MKTANPYLVSEFLRGLAGLGDDDDEVFRFADLDVNDALAMKQVIRERVLPQFSILPQELRQAATFSLRYYLSTNQMPWRDFLEARMPPFDAPDDARQLFVWIWEVIYPDEHYALNHSDTAGVVEKPEIGEAHALILQARQSGFRWPHERNGT